MIFRDRVPGVRLPGLLRGLCCLACGALVALGFAPTSVWPLILLGLACFTILIAGRSLRGAAGYGYLFGLGLCAVAINWLSGLGWWIAALLVVWMALYFLGYAIALRVVLRLPGWPLWVALSWMLVEYVTCRWPFGGFGWIRLGYASVDTPLAGMLRDVGVPGVGLLIALLAQGLAWIAAGAMARRGWLTRVAAVAAATALVGTAGGLQLTRIPRDPDGPHFVVGLVQGNVDGVNKLEPFGRARSVTNNHLSETVDLLAQTGSGRLPAPDLVLWPENSTDIDPTRDPETAAVIDTASRMTGVPILVGAVTDGPGDDERQTGGLLWTAGSGVQQHYFKRNLVPFGEFIPYRSFLLPRIPILKMTGAQGVPGTQPGIFQVTARDGRQVAVGDVICFELAYDATVYDAARRGAQVLVVQSNNASYGGTAQVPQQWAITRARAIETGRDVAVATTDSYSGVIRADGSVQWRSKEFTAASYSAPLALRSDITPAVTIAPRIDQAAAGAGALAIVVGALVPIRDRRRGASGGDVHTGSVDQEER